MLRLCRCPEADRFKADIDSISSEFQVNADALVKAVRRGQVIASLKARQPEQTEGMLLAARDDDRRSCRRGAHRRRRDRPRGSPPRAERPERGSGEGGGGPRVRCGGSRLKLDVRRRFGCPVERHHGSFGRPRGLCQGRSSAGGERHHATLRLAANRHPRSDTGIAFVSRRLPAEDWIAAAGPRRLLQPSSSSSSSSGGVGGALGNLLGG